MGLHMQPSKNNCIFQDTQLSYKVGACERKKAELKRYDVNNGRIAKY